MSVIYLLNNPGAAFQHQRTESAWIIVGLTILVIAVGDPLLRSWCMPGYQIDGQGSLRLIALGLASYIAVTMILWLICKGFGSQFGFAHCTKCWSITFFPNLLCAIIVDVTEVFYYVFWNSLQWGLVLSILYVGILLWKIMLYALFLRFAAGLQGWKLVAAGVSGAVFIALLAALNGALGLKTPVL